MLRTFCWLAACLFSISLVGRGVGQEATPPNIVFILADDLSWADLGCYGHPYHDTPHIDTLASQGVRFTNGYAPAPICSASRASFLTGKTTARLNFEFVTKEKPGRQASVGKALQTPPFTLNLPLEEVTLAERLGQLGYKTAMFGKWHLNAHHKRYLGWSPVFGPLKQGFDVAVEDFGSHPYSWGKREIEKISEVGVFPEDSMVDRAINFIKQDHNRPFFLVTSQFYVHTPVKTPCTWLVDKYEKRLSPDSVSRERRVRYAAFVEELDNRVGRILDAIESSGHQNDTLIVFTSDNGGHPEFSANGPLRGSKWNLYEGGVRVPMVVRLPGGKHAGKQCETPVIGYDLLPTFVDFAGGELPQVDGLSLAPLLRAEMLGDENTLDAMDRHLLWHFPYYHPERTYSSALEVIGINDFAVSKTKPHSALRMGKYKLLHFYESDRTELYDLEADPSEQRDISSDQPSKTMELSRRLFSALHESNARLPVPNRGEP
ncbi:MAG: sulfatase [Aureliella sp.]